VFAPERRSRVKPGESLLPVTADPSRNTCHGCRLSGTTPTRAGHVAESPPQAPTVGLRRLLFRLPIGRRTSLSGGLAGGGEVVSQPER
jgi:hypothetical protein